MEKKVFQRKQKKREKIVIHYSDGTTEEYTTGILYCFEETKNENNKPVLRMTGKHCNTKHLIKEFTYGLTQVVMHMLENEDRIEEFYNE